MFEEEHLEMRSETLLIPAPKKSIKPFLDRTELVQSMALCKQINRWSIRAGTAQTLPGSESAWSAGQLSYCPRYNCRTVELRTLSGQIQRGTIKGGSLICVNCRTKTTDPSSLLTFFCSSLVFRHQRAKYVCLPLPLEYECFPP